MNKPNHVTRRDFVKAATVATSTALLAAAPAAVWAAEQKNRAQEWALEVPVVEDLMREHGVLRRVLLIYEEAVRRIRRREDLNPAVVKQAAVVVNDFIHGYHEKLEEDYLFPALKKAQRMVPTVQILLEQHQAGRIITGKTLFLSEDVRFRDPDREALAAEVQKFIHMYRPHAAREDTVVFPEFKKLLTRQEYEKLGDRFEAKEKELFGKNGFEGIAGKVAKLEGALGIENLGRFTPKE